MSNEKCDLPKGSTNKSFKGYEEVWIPASTQQKTGIELKKISDLPEWAQPVFFSIKTLNVIQSKVYDQAFKTPNNMLICAPTGAGKTIVALLAILQVVGMNRSNDRINLSKFKVVYIAPMKALVNEIVQSFQLRLEPLGIKVRELTGDMQLSKSQIEDTQVIIATPEKWDIVTRKAGERTYTDLVKLLIIDEVHLLHDLRGPVIESIVARTLRYTEQTGQHVRLVGLSATLPNFGDVATFLRVEPEKGLFHFDPSYKYYKLAEYLQGETRERWLCSCEEHP